MNFHICHVFTSPSCEAFSEIVTLLVESLRDLGHTVSTGKNQIHATARNIIVGSNMLKATAIPEGAYVIVYQLEQLWEGSIWWNDDARAILQRANEVWDYDPANIKFLREKLCVEAKHVVVGYHKSLIRIPRREKDIDVLHYGSMNERRQGIIKAIEDAGTKVTHAYGVWGKERDELIARAKLVLNLHFYEAAIFEQVRVSYLLNNGVAVLSESSPFMPYWIRHCYPELIHLAAHSAKECGCKEAERFAEKYPMTEILKGVI